MQLFDRPQKGERAVLVHIDFGKSKAPDAIEEFQGLAVAAGADPVITITGHRQAPDPKFFIGSGKAEQVAQAVAAHEAQVVIVDHPLSPSQERNLEQLVKSRVLDRTGLILDIFAQRARTFEGKLQVELAQLRHLSTRLVRGWTHLERQRGGIGLRGPGETQLETDRRLIAARIKQINKKLEKVTQQRAGQRRARQKSTLPTIAIVGYTNAGKSTLFNALSGARVEAADQLFMTLDPTLRRVNVPGAGPVILADTVGFIRDLPHGLVAAFRATLEETTQATVLLHVVDAHDPAYKDRMEDVNGVLAEIGGDEVPQIEVFNKIDLCPHEQPRVERDEQSRVVRVWLAAGTGAGVELLREALAEYAHVLMQRAAAGQATRPVPELLSREHCWLEIAPAGARLKAQLYEQGVVSVCHGSPDGGWLLQVSTFPDELVALERAPYCRVLDEAQVAERLSQLQQVTQGS